MNPASAPDDRTTSDTRQVPYSAIRQRNLGLCALIAVLVALPSLFSGPDLDWAGMQAVAAVVLAAALVVASAVDIAVRRLPDSLTLPLGTAGLAWIGISQPAHLVWHVLAAALGYLTLWGTAHVYRRRRGRTGLGMGDAKLMGAGGAWLGVAALPTALLVAAVAALVVVAAMRSSGREMTLSSAIPFGPFLALGIWTVWLYGPLG